MQELLPMRSTTSCPPGPNNEEEDGATKANLQNKTETFLADIMKKLRTNM
jgi:hypothetical protein